MHPKTPWSCHAKTLFVLALASALHVVPARAQTPTPTPASSANSANKTRPTPTPVERHEAPTGVYYLIEDTVVPLQNGLRGIPAGTEVRLVRDNGSTLLVAEGEYQFTMKKAQLTNDLDLAATIRKRTATIESLNEKNLQEQETILIKQQQDEIEFLRTHPLATPTPTPTPPGHQ